jgi:hypothetical protein
MLEKKKHSFSTWMDFWKKMALPLVLLYAFSMPVLIIGYKWMFCGNTEKIEQVGIVNGICAICNGDRGAVWHTCHMWLVRSMGLSVRDNLCRRSGAVGTGALLEACNH